MKDLQLDLNGDMTGLQSTDEESIIQSCRIALQRFKGELELFPNDGCQWIELNRHDTHRHRLEVIKTLHSVFGVTDIKVESASIHDRTVTYQLLINGTRIRITL